MPKPLFTKLAAICAVGFLCVIFGCAYAFHQKDRIFLFLSILIGLCSIVRFLTFYHLVHIKAYLVFEGVCVKREAALFARNQKFLFRDCEEREFFFSLDKKVKLLQGHSYRLYFRKLPQNSLGGAEETSYQHGDFIGFEEIFPDAKNLPDSSRA